MTRRDRQLLLGLAALTLALASLTLLGGHSDVLLAAPVLVFALPLLAGRFVGEEQLARLAAAFSCARRRPAVSIASSARRAPRALPRGGRLIATALAVRPPPVTARLTA
ncbi:MAG TPA: hypothetical protein VMY78_17300 [Solirubrobacteraceae bacterium]|nr:hypothetical protein [Solirubrobacteraceae bacterium]